MPPELLAQVPARALAVYAHPDDAEVSCGGTLAQWAAAGCEVHLVLCTLGDKGSVDPATKREELIHRRGAEVEAARKVLGVATLIQLGRSDGEVENDLALRAELVGHLRAVRPDVVICPDPSAIFFGQHYYNHRDHRVVGFAALDAVSPAAASPLYFPERGPAWSVSVAYLSGSLEPNVFVDVSSTIAHKVEAVACHVSQVGSALEGFRPVVEEGAAEVGRAVGVPYAESFRRIRFGH